MMTFLRFLPLCVLISAPQFVHALGFRVVDQDPAATARGEAFAATADNPSAIYYNPAGITQLNGLNVRAGAYGISLETTFEGADGKKFRSSDDIQAVPQFYLTSRAQNSPVALGMGIYAPYGLSVEYDDNTPFRTLARRGSVTYVSANPVVAVELTRTLSAAVGGTFNYAEATLENGVIAPGDRFRFKGAGNALGFTGGLLWKPTSKHSFGLSYHSSTVVEFSGHSSVKTDPFTVPTPFGPFPVAGIDTEEDASARIHFPQFFILGYSFRPTPDWNFEVNVDWTDWDSLNTVTLRNQQTGNVPLVFNYTSSFMYEFGVTRNFAYGLHGSVGYIYSENSVPESVFNPIVPDSDRHIFSVGLGQQLNRVSWDVAYQLAYGPERSIDNGSLADGRYQFISHAVTFALGYRF